MASFRRKQGTGSVYKNSHGKWEAHAPKRGLRKPEVLGRFETQRQAERALALWFTERAWK